MTLKEFLGGGGRKPGLAAALVWLATVLAAAWLYLDVGENGPVPGFADGEEYRVAPVAAGRVATLAVAPGQRVEAGQVVAELDATELDARIRVQEAEVARLEAAIRAEESRARADTASETRRLEDSLERVRTDLSSAEAAARARAAELRTLTEHRARLEDLVGAGLASRQDLTDLDIREAALRGEVEGMERTIAVLRERLLGARGRRAAFPADLVETSIAPLRREKEVAENNLRLLLGQRRNLTLRSPVAGTVSAVHVRPGEVATVQLPVVTIVSTGNNQVVACLPEEQALRVRTGDVASLWPRGGRGEVLRGHVIVLGPLVSELPSRCWPRPASPVWGRNAVVLLDQPADLVAGQTFLVRLDAAGPEGPGGKAFAAAPATGTGTEDVVPMEVPPELSARSRFEPSGVVWVPRLLRYVLVSDDTGREGVDGHAPLLFTMDRSGRVDPSPLRIEGLDQVNDLESIAALPDGTLYLLSSQSRNRKGNRPLSREGFYRLVPSGSTFRLDGMVHLARVLEEAGPSFLYGIGLRDTADLDIEGLCPAGGGGLLVGLKAPLDGEGRAILWRLRDPDRLFGGEGPVAAGLELFGRVRLVAGAGGRNVPAGISAMLALPDGRLLLGATPSTGEEGEPGGTLWLAALTPGGLLQPSPVRTFPGLKPEGISLAPEPGRVVVVFDTGGDAVPKWVNLPWPRPRP